MTQDQAQKKIEDMMDAIGPIEVLKQLDSLCPSDATACSAVGGDFYNGVEWLACWLLDNAEGETITEEQLRWWAAKAWEAHLKQQNT